MKIKYKEHVIEVILLKDEKEGFENELRYIHPTTGLRCESFEQVFSGWSYQRAEENKKIFEMKEVYRNNWEEVEMFLFDELDVDLEKYIY